MSHKIASIFKTTVVLVTAVVFHTYGQKTSLGAKFTANRYPSARVENPSPSNIYGSKHSSIETGIYALKYFKSERMGIKMGLEFGLIPWDLGVDAPNNAFGTGTGDFLLRHDVSFNDFSYKAVTISASYKVPLKNRFLEISAGASVRDYAFGDGDEGIYYTFNRSIPYDPDDPSQSPDINAVVKSLDDQFHISFPVSVDYVLKTSNRTQLKIGVMRNIAVKPISDSELTVIMYGETYKGKYSPLTGFWGFNMQFDYNLKKSGGTLKTHTERSDLMERYRKALYVERRGSGISLTANYDMRLKKNRNDGLGFKAGFGNGRTYYTPVTNNNKSTLRTYLSLPLGINYILGKNRHGLETGVGFTPQVALDNVEDGPGGFISTIPLNIGYRFQPIKEGLIARVAWTPTFNKYGFYAAWTGLSLGYSFR